MLISMLPLVLLFELSLLLARALGKPSRRLRSDLEPAEPPVESTG
jgi:Sec-independent protein secretion pathway component TatC